MTILRAVIVDDEVPACELLRAFLGAWPVVHIVGEARDGETALTVIRQQRPDVVFLDVQMPDASGFDIVSALAPDEMPVVVFVTAYDQYALRAFDVSACDYLLKPFDADRLALTMTRVLARHGSPRDELGSAVRALLAHIQQPGGEQIVVKADGRHLFLTSHEIVWMEAVGKDVRIHTGKSTLTIHESMTSLEQRLAPSRFVRVHRSAIVNRSHVRELQPWYKGNYVLILRDATRIVTGPSYRESVRRLLG
jgi:two-component system LytT family response regulator